MRLVAEPNSSEEEYEDEYGAECDANGDVAICDACNKVLPLSKFEKHISYFCKKQVAECPLCFEKFPSGVLPYHMDGCKVAMKDPNMVTCKFELIITMWTSVWTHTRCCSECIRYSLPDIF